MGNLAIRVRVQPQLGAAMAGFATHTIGDLETLAPITCRDVVGMAVQANPGLGCIAQPQFARDRLRTRLLEYLVGLGMRIEFLPDREFVLRDVGIAERL